MWKDTTYFDGYIVSDEGEVARKDTGQVLKQYPQKNGYVSVYLRTKYGNVAVPVHRLVCIAFHGEQGYIDGMYVDHIDTNRANNNANNLHWVTPKGNANNPITLAKRHGKEVQ